MVFNYYYYCMLWNYVEQIRGQNMDETHSFVYIRHGLALLFNSCDENPKANTSSSCVNRSIPIRAEAAASVFRKAIIVVIANLRDYCCLLRKVFRTRAQLEYNVVSSQQVRVQANAITAYYGGCTC